MYKLHLIVFLFFMPIFNIIGQNADFPLQHKVYKCTEQLTFQDFFNTKSTAFNLSPETEMIDVTRLGNKYSDNHKKYKQMYKGIEVYGVSYFLHGKNGFVTHGTGTLLPDIQLDINPDLDLKTAESKAITSIRNVLVMPFRKSKDAKKQMANIHLQSTERGMVVIVKAFTGFSGSYALVYRFEIYSENEPLKYQVIVSAIDGKMIFNQSMIKHGHADGIGKTFYYGNQKIVTDSLAPNQFVLRDLTRGQGITTYTNKSKTDIKEFVDTDNVWDDAQAVDLVGIDAHYCTEKFYDMMVTYCGYSGLDGNGLSFNPVVYAEGSDNFVNAYWDGDKAYFGQGNCHYGPLVTHSVVSHEFTHGVTQYNSNLIYDGESGAINESLSDIFGKSAEYLFDRSRFSWDLGPEFTLDQFAENFRSMSTPNTYGHPKTYKGLYWEDSADVHVNSSVFNHWYYLMIEGESGISENGKSYDIKPVSIQDALDIVFLSQTSYLTPSSGYGALYDYSILACEALFGNTSDQYKSVVEAWKAVGLPIESNGDEISDLSISSPVSYELTCLDGTYYSLVLNIKNEGNTSIPSGDSLTINLMMDGFSKNIEVVLSEDLVPGQTKEITLNDEVYIDVDDYVIIQISLNYEDNIKNNNITFITLENYISNEPDLEFNSVVAQVSCFTTKRKIEGYVINSSCSLFQRIQS
ncbi:MAG: M4 family metallopeptidase [Saprospiraceae bacterium]|nr:M4 family metallopeptidase [Saprospiraceae bacterium]